jgi:predicted MFS family arabinose efflux permease
MARSYSRRAAILVGGFVTAAGVIGILAFDPLALQLVAAVALGGGGIVVFASGAALVADATATGDRPRRFGQQIALGTIAGFLSSFIAGQLAVPVATALSATAGSLLVVRVLVGTGGVIAAASAVPILLVSRVPVPRGGLDAPVARGLLLRFAILEAIFGFGAGSFLPFINLFFADRFGLAFDAIGLALGAIAVGGSLGALLHGRALARRMGQVGAVVTVQALSLPFALLAGLAASPLLVAGLLAVRAGLMYGSASTWRAFQLSSFRPAERAGVSALLAIANSGTGAIGALLSGTVRASFGDAGWTANLVTLAVSYLIAVALCVVFFRAHEPSGDATPSLVSDAAVAPVPHSPA